jgi:hypothetical protein
MCRDKIINKINEFGVAKNWKIVLDIEEDTDKVRLTFYKKSGLEIKLFFLKQPMILFQTWRSIRKIVDCSYEDLLNKLEKYPFLLETEMEIINDR